MKAIRNTNAKAVCKAFEDVVLLRWGAPRILLTDNGTEFANKLMTDLLKAYGIRQVTIPPYRAQANVVKRVNNVAKGVISAYVGRDHKIWDVHLQ